MIGKLQILVIFSERRDFKINYISLAWGRTGSDLNLDIQYFQ